MSKLKGNQSGIAHVAAIALIVVIVVVGFVGWKVWDNIKSKEVDNKTTASTPSTNTSTPKTSTTSPSTLAKANDFTDSRKVFGITKPKGWTVKESNTENSSNGWNKQPLSQFDFTPNASSSVIVTAYLFNATKIEDTYSPIFVNNKSITYKDKTINGYSAKYTEWESEDGTLQDYWLIKNSQVLWLDFSKTFGDKDYSQYTDDFNSIVNSVIFL